MATRKNRSGKIPAQPLQIQIWRIERLVFYASNPRKNDAAVDRMVASIREFGFKIPVLARSDGEVVDGHLRLKAAKKLGIRGVPVILCDEWSEAQVKAFRLMVNRSVTWAEWDDDLLAQELADLKGLDFDLSLTGFDDREIDYFLSNPADDDAANLVPPLPEHPTARLGDVWLLGSHRVICGDCTEADVISRLLGSVKPRLMVTDPPYGVELDSEWRDRAGINKHGPAEPSYMKRRIEGHTQTSISGDSIADWSHAFELVPSLQSAYIWHASRFTSEVLAGLLRIGFLHHQQIIWRKTQAALTRTHYWFSARTVLVRQEKERAVVRPAWREHDDLGRGLTKNDHGRLRRGEGLQLEFVRRGKWRGLRVTGRPRVSESAWETGAKIGRPPVIVRCELRSQPATKLIALPLRHRSSISATQ